VELKEIHILNNTLHDLLTESAQNTLKQKVGSEKEYNKFLIALLEVVISKRSSPSLKDILNLLGISHIQNDLQQKATDIIEGIADLHFKGYDSEYTQWLRESENETFTIHLAFLKETKSGISQTERESLKNKLVNIDKLDAFEFEEKDIRSGIILTERARLKKRFNELYSELRTNNIKPTKNRKFAIIFSLVIASSIVFAIVNPTVRHFIIEKYHKLIGTPEEHEGDSESRLKSAQALPVSADSASMHATDSLQESLKISNENHPSEKTKKDTLKKVKAKTDHIHSSSTNSVFFDNEGVEYKTEKDYEAYFKANKAKLTPIEGFWMLVIREKSNTSSAIKVNCAIVNTAKNKYELIHLNKLVNLDNPPNKMYFELISPLEGYNFNTIINNKVILKSKGTLKPKEGLLIFESEYDARLFNPKNKKEMVKCKVSAYNKSTLNEGKVTEK
jgi:hypothetical protein